MGSKINLKTQKANLSRVRGRELSDFRKTLSNELNGHDWYKNTTSEIKEQLFNLPEDFDGFLNDLSKRGDHIGNLDILELAGLKAGNFTVICIFKVRSMQTNEIFTYEYVSGKYGSNPGYRGILFLEVDGEIKYFVMKRAEKFALGGEKAFDSMGGFILYQKGKLVNLPTKVEQEIKRQLGLKDISIKRFIDLGLMTPDSGMVSTRVSLFAATIDANNAPELKNLNSQNIRNTKKISFELMILPIENLNEYIHKIDDSYFLACVARLSSIGILKIHP